MDKLPLPTPNTVLQTLFTSHANTHITHLSHLLSTSNGIDTTLTLIEYTSSLLSVHLSVLQTLKHRLLIHLLSTSLPPTTILLSPSTKLITRIPPSSPSLRRLSTLSTSLLALSTLCSDVRAFTRLWGLLGIYTSARRTLLHPPTDRVLRSVAWAQTLLLGLYYVFENGAYLAGKGVLRGWSVRRRSGWERISARCFFGWVGVEWARLWRVGRVRERRRSTGLDTGIEIEGEKKEGRGRTEEKEMELQRKEGEEWSEWKRDVVLNAAYTPMAVHWASGNGMLGNGTVGVLMTLVAWVRFRALWAQTT